MSASAVSLRARSQSWLTVVATVTVILLPDDVWDQGSVLIQSRKEDYRPSSALCSQLRTMYPWKINYKSMFVTDPAVPHGGFEEPLS